MGWASTLGWMSPFMLIGLAAGALFGFVAGRLLFFAGMGFAAGTAMGAAWIVRARRP